MQLGKRDIYADPGPHSRLTWGWLAPILAVACALGTGIVGAFVLERIALGDMQGSIHGAPGLLAFLLLAFAPVWLLTLAWVRFFERRTLASIGLGGAFRAFALGHALGVASLALVVAAIWIAGGYAAQGFGEAFESPRALLDIAALLFAFALQGGAEELVFRGWLLSVLARKYGVAIGVLLSSALFALLHYAPGQPPRVMLGVMLFALFACAWALRARSILGVMGWHAGWNWLCTVGFALPLTGLDAGIPPLLVRMERVGPDWLTGGADGPEGSVVSCAFLALAIGALLATARRR